MTLVLFTPLSPPTTLLGASKGFGFAQFSTLESSRAFVDPNFPFIQVPPPASHGASATQAFWKALETGAQHTGRRVKIDYSQSANPSERKKPGQGNDGTRDIGNQAAPVLLFRGLDPLSGPQAILQAMKTSSGLHKEGAKGMKRIVLIKDKTTLASWGFAFVEFVDVQVCSCSFVFRASQVNCIYSLHLPFWRRLCHLKSIRMGFVSRIKRWRPRSHIRTRFSQ